MVIAIIFFTILFVLIFCEILNNNMEDSKLKFISFFTLILSINILVLIGEGDTSFTVILRWIALSLSVYGFISGVQYMRRKS